MLAREMLAVAAQPGLEHLDIKCLPAMWHHHPEHIAGGVERAIAEARREGIEHIFIAYADCGTGGALDAVCMREGVARIPGPHCFGFYIGNETFAREDAEGSFTTTFFVTDFLARHAETFLYEPLGLNRHPELRDLYFGNYERVLHLAQTDDPELQRNARNIAARLGLPYEYRHTGYGDLATELSGAAGIPPPSMGGKTDE